MASFSLQVGELDETGTLHNLQTTVSTQDVVAGSDDDESGLSWEEDFDEFSEEEDSDVEFQPNTSQQLLNFVNIVNKDIQKYFGKRKFLDDVNDDKLRKNKKSGRELYYADLLRIAKNGDADENEEICDKNGTLHKINWKEKRSNGRSSSPLSLGPFGELFKTNEVKTYDALPLHGLRLPKSVADAALPWKKRNLPLSFFKEPELRRNENGDDAIKHGSDPSKTLDFSDLLAHWIGEDSPDGHSSEFSSSTDDMSLQSL